MSSTMEVLREIKDNELNYIISRLEKDLPYAIKDLQFILSSKRSKKLSNVFTDITGKILPTFYVPRDGIKDNCTIFAITSDHETIWYFTYQESLNEVRNCLENTNLIKWTKTVMFVTIHQKHSEIIFEYVRKKNYKIQHIETCFYYYLPKKLAKQIKVP